MRQAHAAADRRRPGSAQPAEEQLGVDRGIEGLGVEEAGAVWCPPLGLVPVAVGGAHDVLVDQARAVRAVGIEARDADVRSAVAAFGRVPVQRRPHDVVARPATSRRGSCRAARCSLVRLVRCAAVAPHDPHVGAEPAEAGRADAHRMAGPGMEQDPFAVRAEPPEPGSAPAGRRSGTPSPRHRASSCRSGTCPSASSSRGIGSCQTTCVSSSQSGAWPMR